MSVLTPTSKLKRNLQNKRTRATLTKKVKELEKQLTESRIQLSGDQQKEMSKIVTEINAKDHALLEKIFNEASSHNKTVGLALRKAWEMDSQRETNGFQRDQEKCEKGSSGNRWSPLTYRIALSVYSRSPAAYEALAAFDILKLPSVHTLRAKIRKIPSKQGVDLAYLKNEAERFSDFVKRCPDDMKPTNEGVLIYDEVKVIGKLLWNSRNDQFVGCAMNSKDFCSLEDLYKDKKLSEVLEAEYVLQYLWRCVDGKFDIIGPYFMLSKPVPHTIITNTVLKVIWAFQSVGLKTIGLVCDGGSSNVASLRQMLGIDRTEMHMVNEDGSYGYNLLPRFQNPFASDESWIHFIICPSHQLKNMINALHHSQKEGTRDFSNNGIKFGWQQLIDMKKRESDRIESDELTQVKGLRQSHIDRDPWTKLNVTPARIMQQLPVLGELHNYSNPLFELPPKDRVEVMACYHYLYACHQVFECGLLSHDKVQSGESKPILSMLKGLEYFESWATGILKSGQLLKNNKTFLAWQTWELLRIAIHGFIGFVTDFCKRNPEKYIYPVRINGSAVETIFSQLKYVAAGKLTSENYRSARRSLVIKGCTKTSQNAESSYRKVGLDIIDSMK